MRIVEICFRHRVGCKQSSSSPISKQLAHCTLINSVLERILSSACLPQPSPARAMSSQRRALTSSGPAGNAALGFQHSLAPPSSMKKPLPRSSGLPRASMAAHPYSTASRPSSASGEPFNHKRRSMMPPSRPADALTSSATPVDGRIMGRTPQAARGLTQ